METTTEKEYVEGGYWKVTREFIPQSQIDNDIDALSRSILEKEKLQDKLIELQEDKAQIKPLQVDEIKK